MEWRDYIERIGPNDLVEVKDANVWFQNRKDFERVGFTLGILDQLYDLLEQQLWSVLALWQIAKQAKASPSILEIGSGRGGSLATMALARPDAKFTNIDPFEPYEEETAGGIGKNQFSWEKFIENITPFGLDLMTLRELSDKAVTQIEDDSQHMIFIDGNHGYEGCASDIRLYRPKLKEGGILCGHDYHPRFPGVIQAVREAFGRDFTVFPQSSVWVAE